MRRINSVVVMGCLLTLMTVGCGGSSTAKTTTTRHATTVRHSTTTKPIDTHDGITTAYEFGEVGEVGYFDATVVSLEYMGVVDEYTQYRGSFRFTYDGKGVGSPGQDVGFFLTGASGYRVLRCPDGVRNVADIALAPGESDEGTLCFYVRQGQIVTQVQLASTLGRYDGRPPLKSWEVPQASFDPTTTTEPTITTGSGMTGDSAPAETEPSDPSGDFDEAFNDAYDNPALTADDVLIGLIQAKFPSTATWANSRITGSGHKACVAFKRGAPVSEIDAEIDAATDSPGDAARAYYIVAAGVAAYCPEFNHQFGE